MEMKTRYHAPNFMSLFYLTTILVSALSLDSPFQQDQSACVLNFSSFPYQPTGECIGTKEKVYAWHSSRTTLCCKNLLTVLSKTLALHTRSGKGDVFVDEAQWKECSGPFRRQPSVSVDSCRFSHLFFGSSLCSGLSVSRIQQEETYKNVSNKCAQVNKSSFDDACGNCTLAILRLRNTLLESLNARGNGTEREICGVALVITLAAEILDNQSSLDDFYGCLTNLDVLEPGYIKIRNPVAKTMLALVLAATGLMLIIMLIKYVTKHKRDSKPVQSKEMVVWSGLYRFSKAEIETAIGLSAERKSLGRGSAGQVYKGILPSGQVVAIKQIFKSTASDSFTREVEGLSRVRHPNLVCLFGCCVENGEQYLVYEYCAGGNLAKQLLRKDTVLTWERRVKILRDCALALRYLHHYIDGCIVHRDIKLTNILLTERLEPKLSDFGLARMLGMEESKVFTDVRGTIGYMDPEYMSNAKLTCASDIYSFGIVALQLLSGQKVIELDLDARDQLTRKAKDVSMGKRPLSDFVDARLNGKVNYVDFESVLQVAVLCVASSSKGRPTINVVFEEMEKAWKNTLADMRPKEETPVNSSATPKSGSLEVIPV